MKVVLTYGTYDLLHIGHIDLLRRAKALGDYLIVGLSTDEFNTVKGKKAYHNFEETPENLMASFSELTALAPRVVKIAVMPNSEQDVLNLMNYTRGFKTLNPEQEYATMSMGKLGRSSRLAVDVFGSSWSFACLDQVSAPGQIALQDLRHIREVLNEN